MAYEYYTGPSSYYNGPGYNQNLYNQQLSLSQSNYQNVMNSYSSGQNLLASTLPSIYAGYGNLNSEVANTLGFGGTPYGVLAPEVADIKGTFKQQRGANDQQLINAGLGNTTVRQNLANQNVGQQGRVLSGLSAQLAQMYAGAQQSIGLQGLAARSQGAGLEASLYGQEGSTLANYRFPQAPYSYGGSGGMGGGGGRGGFGFAGDGSGAGNLASRGDNFATSGFGNVANYGGSSLPWGTMAGSSGQNYATAGYGGGDYSTPDYGGGDFAGDTGGGGGDEFSDY